LALRIGRTQIAATLRALLTVCLRGGSDDEPSEAHKGLRG
jgi:hypothetical protein